jgi:hypothetical protein
MFLAPLLQHFPCAGFSRNGASPQDDVSCLKGSPHPWSSAIKQPACESNVQSSPPDLFRSHQIRAKFFIILEGCLHLNCRCQGHWHVGCLVVGLDKSHTAVLMQTGLDGITLLRERGNPKQTYISTNNGLFCYPKMARHFNHRATLAWPTPRSVPLVPK